MANTHDTVRRGRHPAVIGIGRGRRTPETGLVIDPAIAGRGIAPVGDFFVAADLAAGRLMRS